MNRVREQLVDVLELQECRLEYGSLIGHPPRPEPDGTVLVGHRSWDVEQWGLPRTDIELRTFGNGQYYGRFMLLPKLESRPSVAARLIAEVDLSLRLMRLRDGPRPSSTRTSGRRHRT